MYQTRFQNILSGLSRYSVITAGVIDSNGLVCACTDEKLVGHSLPGGRLFESRPLDGDGGFEVFSEGKGEEAIRICEIISFMLTDYPADGDDPELRLVSGLVRGEISDADSIVRAGELGINCNEPRTVLAVKIEGETDVQPYIILKRIFSVPGDYVIPEGVRDFAIVIGPSGVDDAVEVANLIADTFGSEFFVNASVGVGTVAASLGGLGKSYSNALFALKTGRIFGAGRAVMKYSSLGIGRLVAGLSADVCREFLSEINGLDQLDNETLLTVNAFCDNGLNVSETARSIFVHRNTLLYRLEKIRRATGLDIRIFDQAVTLRIALMVRKYLDSLSVVTENGKDRND